MDDKWIDVLARSRAAGVTRRSLLRSVAIFLGIAGGSSPVAGVHAQAGFLCCDYACGGMDGYAEYVPDTVDGTAPRASCSLADVIAVSNCAKCGPPTPHPPGTSTGEPHLRTPDGFASDFQAVGEFVLLASTEDDFAV